jgi:hypothetical protein
MQISTWMPCIVGTAHHAILPGEVYFIIYDAMNDVLADFISLSSGH